MQAEESALMAVDMAAAERRIHSALQTHVSQLRHQLESEQRQQMVMDIIHQVEEEKAQKLAHARQQMQQEVAQAVAQEAAQEVASQQAAQLASAAHQETARAEQAAGTAAHALSGHDAIMPAPFLHALTVKQWVTAVLPASPFLAEQLLSQQLHFRPSNISNQQAETTQSLFAMQL